MKEVIVLIFGLIRTLEDSFKKLKNNITHDNEKFNYTYIINTQVEEQNKDEILDKINKIFQNENLLDIIIYNLPNQKNNKILDANYIIMKRLQKTLNILNNYNKYDIYINIRTDICIIPNIKIDLNKYNTDLFTIIPGNFTRPCIFHNRDWDLLWIGSYKSFFIWYYSYIYGVSKVKEYSNDNDFIKYNEMNLNLDYNLNSNNKNLIIKKYNLIEEKINNWYIIRDFERYDNMYHKCIKNLEDNNCSFEMSTDIFSVVF
jgi:hypothetical protein